MLIHLADGNFTNNAEARRFELNVRGDTVFANYRIENSVLYISYVESPPHLRGNGAASQLMERIVGFARDTNYRIVPICSYATLWLNRHKECQDIVA